MTISIDNLIRSKRKTISIMISKEGKLIIKAPLNVSEAYIKEIINKRKDWIIDKRSQILNRKKPEITYYDGKTINIFDEPYKIKFAKDDRFAMKITKEKEIVIADDLIDDIKFLLPQAIKKLSKPKFEERAIYWSNIMGYNFKQIKLSSANGRWGSCSNRGNINLNWKLALAPLHIIDHIIVHELAHLKEMNHSAKFWEIVAKHFPQYKECKKWLVQNGHLLEV